MNELEREIEEKKLTIVPFSGESGRDIFKAGANFILEKNLLSKFCSWKQDHTVDMSNGKGIAIFIKGQGAKYFTIEELEYYWLNNVYGK